MKTSLVVEKGNAYLLTDVFSCRYFTGIENQEGIVLITQDKILCFADARYYYALEQKLKDKECQAMLYTGLESIKQCLQENAIKTLFIDYDTTTLTKYQEYNTLGVEIKDGSKNLKECRKQKTAKEIISIKKACQIAKDAFDYILPFIKEGVSETSIKNRLERFMIKQGASGPSFETIVAFGKNSAVPHHETGNARLKKNQAVLLDYGCVVDGYCSDITRTVFFGEPTIEFKKAFFQVAEANLLGMDRASEGKSVKELDGVVREFFKSQGVEEYFTHSLGHGIGLQIHEEPYLSKRGEGQLKENYVFSIEPGLYYNGKFGIRIENTVMIQNGQAVSLTGNGRELIIIK
jgi:Xaa-Pro aminopeptidase